MAEPVPAALRPSFERGCKLFNREEFWEAHEAWEEIWLPSSGSVRQYLQGLIQIAAAFHHVGRKNWRGAWRLLHAGGEKLRASRHDVHWIDANALLQKCAAHVHEVARRARGEEAPYSLPFPRIEP